MVGGLLQGRGGREGVGGDGAAARGCYKGTQGMGGLGIVSIRTLLYRFEPLL